MQSECSYLIELAQPSQLKDYFSWALEIADCHHKLHLSNLHVQSNANLSTMRAPVQFSLIGIPGHAFVIGRYWVSASLIIFKATTPELGKHP